MDYATLKWIHISAVTVSFWGFVARGVGVWHSAPWVRYRITRRLADLVDTVLLLSALGMLSILHLWPGAVPWLRAKIIGLAVYIALGVLALRPERSGGNPEKRQGRDAGRPARSTSANRPRIFRVVSWIGALVVFGYIVSVALTKSPQGPLVWLRAHG